MDLKRELRRIYSRLYGPYDYSSHVIALHDYGAIYMAVPKVANTSIKTALARLMPEQVQQLAADVRKERSVYGRHRDELFHHNIRLYKHQVHKYKEYLVFAFVRDPWDRLVSCYRDKIEWGAIMEDGRRNDPKTRGLYLGPGFEKQMSFEEFARKVAAIPDRKANRHFRSQHAFLCNRKGELIPDFIGRFERLSEDFAELMERIGASKAALPHVRKSKASDHRTYYSQELAQLIGRRYARDAELFGYRFGEEHS